jgi:hypothetical protein
MFFEQLQDPSHLWERHPYDTVSGAWSMSLPGELHDEHNVQLAANQRRAQESEEESEEQLDEDEQDEEDENTDEDLDAEESEEQLDEQDEYEGEDLDEEEDEDETSGGDEQRVDDALEVSTEVTVASSFYDIDRLKAVAAEIAGVHVSPEVESPAARGRGAQGGRRAAWAKIRTSERVTNDGVTHPTYVLYQSSEEDDGD